MARILRRLLIGLAVLVVLVVVGVVGVVVWGNSDSGRGWIAGEIGRLASSAGQRVALDGVTGSLPFHPRVRTIEVADETGIWLRLSNVAIDLDGGALLGRTAHLERLAADRLELLRAPVAKPTATPAPSNGGFSLPDLPVAVILDRLDLPVISVAPGVAGQPLTASLGASGRLAGGAGAIDLSLDRRDQPGAVTLHGAYQPGAEGGRLTLSAKATEPSGQLLAPYFPDRQPRPLTLTLDGAGPIDRWSGQLAASLGQDADLSTSLVLIRHAQDLTMDLKGAAHVAPLLDEKLRALVGPEITFDLEGARADAGPLGLDRFALTLAAGTVKGRGRYDPASGGVTALVDLDGDLASLQPFTNNDLTGKVAAEATVTGTAGAPSVELDLTGRSIATNGSAVDALTGHLKGGLGADRVVTLSGTSHLDGVRVAGTTPSTEAGDALDLAVDLRAKADGQEVTVKTLTLEGVGLDLAATGNVAAGAVRSHVTLHTDDLARLAGFWRAQVTGGADIEADLKGSTEGAVDATVTGKFVRFRLGVPAVDAALGGAFVVKASGGRGGNGVLKLGDLAVTGPNLTLAGTGSYDQPNDRLALHATLDLPNLAPIGNALGSDAAGGVKLVADAAGTAASSGGSVVVTGSGIAINKARIDTLTLKAESADLQSRAGTITGEVTADKVVATLKASVAETGKTVYAVKDLLLTGPDTKVKGAIAYDTATGLAQGNLDGRATDLAGWAPLVGDTLGGHVVATVSLGGAREQSVNAHLDAGDLAYGSGLSGFQARLVKAEAALTLPRGKPAGTASVTLAGVRARDLALENFRAHAASNKAGGFDLDANGAGDAQGHPFTIDTRGTAKFDAANSQIVLAGLDGKYGDLAIHLKQPARFDRSATLTSLRGLALSLNSGSITADAALGARQVTLAVHAKDLPLGTLAALGGRDNIAGTASLDATLAGAPSAPQGQLDLKVSRLQLNGQDTGPTAALDIVMHGDVTPRALGLKGKIAGSGNEGALDLSGTVPLAFAPSGLVSLPPGGALALQVAGNGRIETLAPLLPLGEDKAGGAYQVSLAIGGTVSAPRLAGKVTLANGSYENGLSGMTLRNLAIEADGDGDSFFLRSLKSGDGEAGSIAASGRVTLAGTGPTVSLDATLDHFTATRRDDVTSILSGTAKIEGTLAAPTVTSELTVDRAEINLPQSLPSSTPHLAVIRIDSRTPRAVQLARLRAAHNAAEAAPIVAKLAIRIHDSGQTFVRGNGLDSEWKADLTVGGTSVDPSVMGTLELINGTLSLLGTDFTLKSGLITFTGGLVPTLDIVAEATTSSLTADVTVSGTAAQPKLAFSSTPDRPQDEILAQVMFGSGLNQISPAEGLQVAAAAASLVGGGGPGVLDRLRSSTGLDRLSFGGASSAAASQSNSGIANTTVSGGKYLAPGVFVGVDQGVSGGSTRARVEISVLQHVTINAIAGASSNAGSSLGAQYRIDY